MTTPFADSIALRETSPLHYESLHNPKRMGNTANIAYGGCTLAVALNAACQTAPATHTLYSALGHYLGPATTDSPYLCHVQRIRDTRTFATRLVLVSQAQQANGSDPRPILQLTADFHACEPSTSPSPLPAPAGPVAPFSAVPSQPYSGALDSPLLDDDRARFLRDGAATPRQIALHRAVFGLKDGFFEQRNCAAGVMAQNLTGLLKRAPTSQDGRPLAAKRSADWFRLKERVGGTTAAVVGVEEQAAQAQAQAQTQAHAVHVSALIFMLDGALSFVPLVHDHKFLDDAGPCASLDFALRVLVRGSGVDVNAWHLREMGAVAGGDGRTFSEARLWDERGTLVAVMSQQCVLRAKPATKQEKAVL